MPGKDVLNLDLHSAPWTDMSAKPHYGQNADLLSCVYEQCSPEAAAARDLLTATARDPLPTPCQLPLFSVGQSLLAAYSPLPCQALTEPG